MVKNIKSALDSMKDLGIENQEIEQDTMKNYRGRWNHTTIFKVNVENETKDEIDLYSIYLTLWRSKKSILTISTFIGIVALLATFFTLEYLCRPQS